MKTVKSAVKTWLARVSVLALVSLLVPVYSMGQCLLSQPAPPPGQLPTSVAGVPIVVSPPSECELQLESHFLTFIGSFRPEDANSSTAYYNTIDPLDPITHQPSKPTFQKWLVRAGFIKNEGQWHNFGKQVIACDLGTANGCDVPAHNPDGSLNYGDNIINTDSHAIVLNAADLGFVRNQFIRCIDPSNLNSTTPCKAKNPIIYTYLENYPVEPYTQGVNGSGFPFTSGYPHQDEAALAINSALNRPIGMAPFNPAISTDPNLATVCNPASSGCLDRIADVAFEWAPPASNPKSSTRFGQLYAYQFFPAAHNVISETVNFTDAFVSGAVHTITDFKTGALLDVMHGDKFAPNLDFVGFKQHPGVCLICHGGAPASVPTGGPYPRSGNINGFRFLPLDNVNLLFSSDHGPEATSRLNQEAQIKEYNLAVLRTVPTYAETDDQGVTRVAHLREVITGWYSTGGKYSDDTSLSGNFQKSDWVPKGWREPPNGTAPAGAEQVYHEVLGPTCRSCHFNRELSLDFGTYANFHQESDLQQLALIAECKQGHPDPPDPNAKFMPLALLTFNRFWQTQVHSQTLPPLGDSPFTVTLDHVVDLLAKDFGFGTVSGYCATNP
jgi:hypothetical protein